MANSKWSELERADMKFMVESGFKQNEICEVLGKSMDTVRTEIKLMNLKSPRKYREKDSKLFCLKCRKYKDKSNFYKRKINSFGYDTNCISCCNKSDYKRYDKKLREMMQKEKNNIKTKEEINGGSEKICTSCKCTKPIEEFQWRRKFVKLQEACRKCRNEENKKYLLKRVEERGY